MTLHIDLVSKFINRIINNQPADAPPSQRFPPRYYPSDIGSGKHVTDIAAVKFGGSKYTKKQLASFLSDSCSLLVDISFPKRCTTPSKSTTPSSVPDQSNEEEVTSLRKELADAHRRVIDLQDQVIKLQGEIRSVETATVTKTVQRDLKSYSAMLTQNCVAAFAPNRIQRAVTKATAPEPDEEDRSRNLIVFGLPEETDGVSVEKSVESLLEEVDQKPKIISCVRLGTVVEGKVRPVKVSLESRDSLLVLLKKASKLRSSENYNRVYLEPDRSYDERVERRRAVKTLNELRKAHPERKFVLRKGVIESI